MHTDTPSAGPALDLAWFGALALVGFAATGGRAALGLLRLALVGTPYPGHYHGLRR